MNTLSAWRVKAIDDNTLGYLVPDVELKTNAGKMSAAGTITTESIDTDRDIIRTKGIDLGQHRRNPVVTLCHQHNTAIGKAEDRMGSYTVKMVGGNRLDSETYFSRTNIGEESFRLVEERILRGLSVDFPKASAVVSKGYDQAGQEIQVYESIKLLAYSLVPLPANLDCLISRVEKGYGRKGKLCPELDALLRPMIPERDATVVSGWDGTIRKAWDEEDHPDAKDRKYKPGTVHADILDYLTANQTASLRALHALRPSEKYEPLKPLDHSVNAALKELRDEGLIEECSPVGPAAVGYSTVTGNGMSVAPGTIEPSFRLKPLSGKSNRQPMVIKMADPYEDTLGGAAVADPEASTGVDDPPELDPASMDEGDDGMGDMKPGAQLAHAGHDVIVNAIGFFTEAAAKIDNPVMQKATDKLVALLGKAMSGWQASYADYASEHGTEPLPGAPEVPPAEGETDEDSDAIPSDDDEPEDDDDTADDDSDDDEEEFEKKEKKHARAVMVAKAWWASYKRNLRRELAGESLVRVERIEKALQAIDKVKDQPKRLERIVKGIKAEMGKVKLTPVKSDPIFSVALADAMPSDDEIFAAVQAAVVPLAARLNATANLVN